MQKTLIGYALAVFTVMTWSLNIIYSKYLAGQLGPSEISFFRWFIALFLMIPISFQALKRDWYQICRHWKIVFLMAFSGLGVQNWLIYCAGYTASATNMSLISILGPVFLILMSRQKIGLIRGIGIISAISGVILIILHGSLANLESFRFVSGDFYMLGSAFLFAVYALIQRQTPNTIDPTALLTSAIIVSALVFVFPALTEISAFPLKNVSCLAVVILLILGFVNSALAYLSWDIVIKKIGAVNAGTMYYTLPIFSITSAYFLLHEPIYESQLIGAVFILLGVLCVIFETKKSETQNGR